MYLCLLHGQEVLEESCNQGIGLQAPAASPLLPTIPAGVPKLRVHLAASVCGEAGEQESCPLLATCDPMASRAPLW